MIFFYSLLNNFYSLFYYSLFFIDYLLFFIDNLLFFIDYRLFFIDYRFFIIANSVIHLFWDRKLNRWKRRFYILYIFKQDNRGLGVEARVGTHKDTRSIPHVAILSIFKREISGKFRKCLPASRNVKYQQGQGTSMTEKKFRIWEKCGKTSVPKLANSRTIYSNHFPLPWPMTPAPSGQGGGILRQVL